VPLNCPSEPELLLLALAEDSSAGEGAERHVAGCPSCQARLAGLRKVIGAIASTDRGAVAGRDECLDELALAAFVEGEPEADQRASVVAHLASCGHCRRELSALVELLADPAVAAEVGQGDTRHQQARPRRKFLAGAGLLAAAAAILLLVWTGAPGRSGGGHRGPTITAGSTPLLMSPVGNVAEARMLRWTAVSGADRYRVTLFDATGKVLFEAQVADTATALPDSIALITGQPYL
jgi:anti-sigma factor RsiW